MISDEQKKLIKILDEGGLLNKEIAQLLGLHPMTVAHWRKKLGLVVSGQGHSDKLVQRYKERTGSRDTDAVRFYLEGQTLQQIGDRFGITRERVRQILRKQGCGPHKQLPKYRTTVWTKNRKKPKPTNADRFWRKVDKRGPDDCWLWTGKLAGATGATRYPYIHFLGKHRTCRQVSFFLAHRRWSTLWVTATCGNRLCLNPAHFEEKSMNEAFYERSPIYQCNLAIKKGRERHESNSERQTTPAAGWTGWIDNVMRKYGG